MWVIGDPIEAYGLVLFHRGTCLARIYSLAVSPESRGKGYGRLLIEQLEQASEEHGTLFIRLEVSDSNTNAIRLYEAMHYQPIRRLPQYYEDGHDGIRMEKRLLRHLTKPLTYPLCANHRVYLRACCVNDGDEVSAPADQYDPTGRN